MRRLVRLFVVWVGFGTRWPVLVFTVEFGEGTKRMQYWGPAVQIQGLFLHWVKTLQLLLVQELGYFPSLGNLSSL